MNLKNILNVSFLSFFIIASFGANANNRNQEVSDTVFLKPERMDLINKLAEEKVKNEEYIETTEVMDSILQQIKKEDEIISEKNSKLKKEYRTIDTDFAPTNEFEKIKVAPNFSTTVYFVDKMNNPWSIEKYTLGGAEYYFPEKQFPHVLTISPKILVGNSNLTVFLKDPLNRPIAFDVVISEESVDYITMIRVNELGDKSPKEIIFRDTGENNSLSHLSKLDKNFISLMLSNVKPEGFDEKYFYSVQEEKYENSEDFRIFHRKDEKYIYVRTKHISYSPNDEGISYTPDRKYKVIKLPYATSYFVVVDGKIKLEKLRSK